MKTLGIIGGIAPESTIEYYRTIVAEFRRRTDGDYPSLIINSIDLRRLLALAGADELTELTEYLRRELNRRSPRRRGAPPPPPHPPPTPPPPFPRPPPPSPPPPPPAT